MELTQSLAQLWGPVIVAVGIGMFTSRDYYLKVYTDIERAPFSVLMFGMLAMVLGIIHVQLHNVWSTLPQIVISVIGWGLFAKGTVALVAPRIFDRAGDWWVERKLLTASGVLTLAIGGYLSWIGYWS
jgi:hypothetical protein